MSKADISPVQVVEYQLDSLVTHFLMKVSFASPMSRFSAALASQTFLADSAPVSHFFTKWYFDIPESLRFAALASQLSSAAKAIWQKRITEHNTAAMSSFMSNPSGK